MGGFLCSCERQHLEEHLGGPRGQVEFEEEEEARNQLMEFMELDQDSRPRRRRSSYGAQKSTQLELPVGRALGRRDSIECNERFLD